MRCPFCRASTVNAILSLSVIALNIVYITPTLCRLTVGRKRFKPGPFTLGRWIYPVAALGTLWVGFAVCIFSLPQVYPVYYRTLNYAGICWLATLVASQIAYFAPFGYGARNWFRGPADETNVRAWLKEQQLDAMAVKAQFAALKAEAGASAVVAEDVVEEDLVAA